MRFTFYLISFLFLTACGVSKNPTSHKNKFSESEIILIKNGNAQQSMRIYLTTSHSDSILLTSKSENIDMKNEKEELKLLTDRMLLSMKENGGVGIAAPQVGILKRIIWVQRIDKELKPYEVYFNPEIIQFSDVKQDVREGCLSIPDTRGTTIDRSYSVLVKYQDANGNSISEWVEGYTAAIFQHEIDHLNGILFIDHKLKKQLIL